MRIKIVRNNPLKDELNICSDIASYINQEFNVLQDAKSGVLIDLYGKPIMVYSGEYELVS